MTDSSIFVNHDWLWQVVIFACVVWLVFLWKELAKTNNKKRYVNAVISFVAITSLALIALKPTVSMSSPSFKVVILTGSYDETQLDSLKKAHKKLTVYNYKVNQPVIPKDKNPDTVFVLGNGLQAYDLWQLDALDVVYLVGHTPKGISQFTYNANNTVGNDVNFKGRYLQPTKGHQLFLENPAGKALDSLVLTNNDIEEFQLSTNLKVKGTLVYQLVEKDSVGAVISKNPIPLIIEEQQKLRILVVNAMPSFETKYLKNYLSEAGHEVAIRTRLTKGRYKYEYFNMDVKPSVQFTQNQLKSYDLVIIDFQTLNTLSSNAKRALETSIEDDGLGLFIQPETSLFNKRNPWYSFNVTSDNKSTTTLDISPKTNLAKYPFIFKNEIPTEPILKNNSNNISAYKRLGIGRVGTSILQNTYELLLKGNPKIYKQLWAKTIESISKTNIPYGQWHSNTLISYQNEPFNFQLRTSETKPLATTNDYQIPLKSDIDIENLWEGTTYPKQTGWQTIETLQDPTNTLKYFVADNSNWQSLKSTNTINANKRYFGNRSDIQKDNHTSRSPINLLWFFVVFTVCMGYLWLEPKL